MNTKDFSYLDSQQNLSKAFKEYKWYNSHAIPLEVQVGISRLEIPTDIQISANDLPLDISITAQIISNQMVQHEAVLSTHFAIIDELRNAFVWDYVMSFPVKLKDLTSKSVIALTARRPDNSIIGGTTMHFFDKHGKLRQGKQKLIFYFGCEADSNVLNEFNKTPGDLYENYSEWDYSFRMEKFMESYNKILANNLAENTRSEWLDKLTLNQVQSTLGNSLISRSDKSTVTFGFNSANSQSPAMFGQSYEEIDLQSFCCLIIELPQYPQPVLHEERPYPNLVNSHTPPMKMADIAEGLYYENAETKALEFSFASSRTFNVNSLVVIADWDVGLDNLSEDMHRKMNHNVVRGNFDVHIKPNLHEKEAIDLILQAPANRTMSFEDMDLLYRFRYSLTENKNALTKFLAAIDFTNESEVAELPILLVKWKEKGPIDIADALKLLGREKCYQYPIVREYAVEVLESASDEDLLRYLLQLVQALRYEPSLPARQLSVNSVSTMDVSNGSVSPPMLASEQRSLTPLARFLISRGCRSKSVANYLFWYLKVETEDETTGHLFQDVYDSFLVQLSSSGEQGRKTAKELEAQLDYINRICACQKEAREQGRKKNDKEIVLRKLLHDRQLSEIPTKGIRSVPVPLSPDKQVCGLNPATASMFASAVCPCVIEFYLDTQSTKGDHDPVAKADASLSELMVSDEVAPTTIAIASPLTTPSTHKIMFKSGDDLRQDQLIMQMISLMDSLLKRVNLDLKLLTYGILAVSPNDGIMEFVSNSMPISAILKNYNNSIQQYLKHYNSDDNGPYEIAEQVIDNFVKSCAGYAVITYILGIGDRHLDNLMITRNGQFFHIDFGFIFGQDPKPLPPPFRLTRSMVDCMGGEDSPHYRKFKSLCYQAYNWLRKSANLILNLISLMGDAGINDISKRSELTKVLAKVEEKFRLDLTDEEAEHHFLGLINESLNSIAPKVMELAHKIAVSMR